MQTYIRTFKVAGTPEHNIQIIVHIFGSLMSNPPSTAHPSLPHASNLAPVTFSEDAQLKNALKLKSQFVGQSILFAHKSEVSHVLHRHHYSHNHHHHYHQALQAKVADVRLIASKAKTISSKIVFDVKLSNGEVQFPLARFMFIAFIYTCNSIPRPCRRHTRLMRKRS